MTTYCHPSALRGADDHHASDDPAEDIVGGRSTRSGDRCVAWERSLRFVGGFCNGSEGSQLGSVVEAGASGGDGTLGSLGPAG